MKILRPTTITDAILNSTNIVEDDHPAWAVGTTYAENAPVIKNHKIYKSTAGANTGNDPEAVGSTWWSYQSHTNAWKMFDGKVGAQSTKATTIALELEPGRVSGIALLNVDALEVEVVMTDPLEGEVFNTTINTITSEGIIDLYTYFFEPFLYNKNIYVDTPVFGDAIIEININAPGGTAMVGEIVLGVSLTIGCTQFGAAVGIVDYSIKQVDAFGNYTILQRAFSKRGSFNVVMDNSLVNSALSVFEEYRATPLVWVPTAAEYLSSPLVIYGYYRDFKVGVDFYNQSSCTLELEGLT